MLDDDECNDSTCLRTLRLGQTPYVNGELPFKGLHTLFDRLQDYIDDDEGTGDTIRPFMVWYSPNVPHEGASSPQGFQTWYPNLDPDENPSENVDADTQTLFERISAFDAGVGAVLDGLKRRCACDANGQRTSLYDNTIFIYINDNGNPLPNADREPTENGERTPIFISEPGHRLPSSDPNRIAPAVREDYASGVDLLGTIVSYAQQTPGAPTVANCGSLSVPAQSTFAFDYPYDRNLCQAVRGTAPVRHVYPSQLATEPTESTDGIRMIITAPGELGVCLVSPSADPGTILSKTAQGHMWLCREGQDSQCPANHVCSTKKRCTNNPGKECDTDKQCAESTWCGTASCAPGGGCDQPGPCTDVSGACTLTGRACTNPDQYKAEYYCRPCTDEGDCVPPGICQAPVVKLMLDDRPPPQPVKKQLFDPNWDPDQMRDLFTAQPNPDPNYLNPNLRTPNLQTELEDCLQGFWFLPRQGNVWGTPSPACVFNETPQGP
jgi:hypothetical protein